MWREKINAEKKEGLLPQTTVDPMIIIFYYYVVHVVSKFKGETKPDLGLTRYEVRGRPRKVLNMTRPIVYSNF